MSMARIVAIMAVVFALFPSCSEDDPVWPSVRTDMGWLSVPAAGDRVLFLPDGGDTLDVTNSLSGLATDTSYRVMATYTTGTTSTTLTGMQSVMVAMPRRYSVEMTDPLDAISVWAGGGCVNLRLSVLSRNQDIHFFGCIDRGLLTWPDGRHSLSLGLYHDQGDDPTSFSRTVYLSFALSPYAEILQPGDTVHVSIRTFDEDEVTHSVVLP